MKIEQRYAAEKYLELLSFPPTFTEEQADAAILALQQSPSVEKVVAVSAFNLVFTPQDFAREFAPTDLIPDAARRGLDASYYAFQKAPVASMVDVPHVDGQFIVRWKDEFVWNADSTGFNAKMEAFNAMAQVVVLYDLYRSATELTQVLGFDPTNVSLADVLNRYNDSPWVVYAQPDCIYETQTTLPDDPIYASKQWSLPKISMQLAWDMIRGSSSVVIAVADTGANLNHPDFKNNLWSGLPQNFTVKPPTTYVYNIAEHGNNVASIIGAQGNNGLYMTGVAWDVSLMILKVCDASGCPSSYVVPAIDYASQYHATAINLSLGGFKCILEFNPDTGKQECSGEYELDSALVDALERARKSNVVAVCAAGNARTNTDFKPFNPASVPTDNVISVANSDQNDVKYFNSNDGARTVDLAAPGFDIYGLKATYNGTSSDLSNYSHITGTSQAAPHVTGTIALLKAKYGWEKYHGLRDRVFMGTDDLTHSSWVVGGLRTAGRLNANKALHSRTLIRGLSTRARAESGDRIMIGGFIIGGSGSGTLKVGIRGLGPSLDPFISVATLPNPKLVLYNNSVSPPKLITSNDDWVNMPLKSDFIAGGLDRYQGNSISSVEAGIVVTLGPGAYTVFLQSNNGGSGVGSFEVYELELGIDEQTRLQAVSTRCLVGIGEEQAIAGVILGDPDHPTNIALPKRSLLISGKGPSLLIAGRLANPFIALYNSDGAQMSSNDSWSSAMASVVKAANSLWSNVPAPVDELVQAKIAPTSASESVLWPILKSGAYTSILSGVSGGKGIGLIEMYEY